MEKTFLEVTEYKEIEIEYPIYAEIIGDNKTIIAKITKDEMLQITHYDYGQVKFFKSQRTIDYLASCWYNNRCKKEVWNDAVSNFLEFTSCLQHCH